MEWKVRVCASVEEVRAAHAAGASETARRALGFDELLAGDVDAMKRHTRSYARRQLTWMRKLAGVTMIDRTGRSVQDVADQIFSAWHAPASASASASAPRRARGT